MKQSTPNKIKISYLCQAVQQIVRVIKRPLLAALAVLAVAVVLLLPLEGVIPLPPLRVAVVEEPIVQVEVVVVLHHPPHLVLEVLQHPVDAAAIRGRVPREPVVGVVAADRRIGPHRPVVVQVQV